jgi:hypothetical protein
MNPYCNMPPELMWEIDRLSPAFLPDPTWSDKELWIRVGERRLIERIKSNYQSAQSAKTTKPYVPIAERTESA